MQQQLVALDRPAQFTHQRQVLGAFSVQAALEHRIADAGAFGLVHGAAGPADQGVRVGAVAGVEGDADARPGIEVQPGQVDWFIQCDEYLLRQLRGLFGAAAGHQYGVFAFADARDHVAGAHRLHQAGGDGLLQAVAFAVSEGFVDLLIASYLQLQQAECPVFLLGAGDRLLQLLA
ncbi:hypothetical protein D9M68_787780 [compost metagenome]